MANSYVEYDGNGTSGPFAVPFPYINKSHVSILVNGVSAAFTWVTDSSVSITTPPAINAVIRILRTTPTASLVNFTDGSTLTEEDLDLSSLQSLYLAQEAADLVEASIGIDPADGAFDALSRRIKNVATPVNGNDAVNKTYADAQATAVQASATAAAGSASTATTKAAEAAASAADALASKNAAAASAAAAATFDPSSYPTKANNLSDLANITTARSNLGLGALATKATAAFADIATAAVSTAAEYRSNAASKLISVTSAWGAADLAAVSYAASVTLDLSTGLNFQIGALTGAIALNNPTNAKPGQSGIIYLAQDGTGSRTISYGTAWKFPSGADKTLSTAASAIDVLYYFVVSSSVILCELRKGYA